MHATASRRRFLCQTASAAGWAASFPSLHALGANARVRLAVMGTNGRGSDLIRVFTTLEGVEIACICDVDERAVKKGVDSVGSRQPRAPRTAKDIRHVLEDRDIDAVVIAAPDHWHGPATILACSAGKHAYVEKPASHNGREGEWMVAAARKHSRVVQVGTQRRSQPPVIEAIGQVRSGVLGRVLFARGWYASSRGSIGRGKAAVPPGWLDWALWQGPAPERPFRDNVVHYNWHWWWHWGTGELGNNGIHALDLCRWGLGVDYPRRVTSGGGRYWFQDDQETPDTHVVTFDFGGKAIAWEGRSCQRHGLEGSSFGASFHGERGTLVIDGGCTFFDADDKAGPRIANNSGDAPHARNFIDCIRSGARPHADIEEGHRSTLLCHLGNIAWRTGRTLDCDPQTGRILGDAKSRRLWAREYRHGWTPRV